MGFATNAITFVYTDKSKFAGEITAQNWHQVLSRPGVQIGRSNPDTDPSGYQTIQMLELAGKYYKRPDLASAVLANAPKSNMRNTETELVAALESGQIDYLAIYRSDARQHHFKYIELPPEIDLSDARHASFYAQASVQTVNGTLAGKPIVYAATIPSNAAYPERGARVDTVSSEQSRSRHHGPQWLQLYKSSVRKRREQGARRIEIAREGMACAYRMRARTFSQSREPVFVFSLLGGLLLVFILLPLFQMYARQNPATLMRIAAVDDVRSAIWLSLEAAGLTALIAGNLGYSTGIPSCTHIICGQWPHRSDCRPAAHDLPIPSSELRSCSSLAAPASSARLWKCAHRLSVLGNLGRHRDRHAVCQCALYRQCGARRV